MQKFHLARRYVYSDSTDYPMGSFLLDYYMIKSEIKIPHSSIIAVVYGVEIEKRSKTNRGESRIETASVKDIFNSREHTSGFVTSLAEKLVTPSDLKKAVEELIGEKGFEPPEVTIST